MHLATEGEGMPVGLVVTGANAPDGPQTGPLLANLIGVPPAAEASDEGGETLSLPRVHGDGAYGHASARSVAREAGFRLCAPSRGRTRVPGVGRVRSAVERGHALLSQFGRVVRRLDRRVRRYTAWCQLAACVIFIRRGFVR